MINRRSNMQYSNKNVLKCQQQRSQFIHRQIGNLIKKEMKRFFQSKQLQKQVQDQQKDYIVMDVPTPIERVQQFRVKQKERSQNMLAHYLAKQKKQKTSQENHKRSIQIQSIIKAKENLEKIQAVKTRYQSIKQAQLQRLQKLKDSYSCCKSQLSARMSRRTAPAYEDPLIQSRIMTAKQKNRQFQEQKVNKYMRKMKGIEQKCLKKDIMIEKSKENSTKISENKINKRNQIEEKKVNNWQNHYDKSFTRFNKNRNIVISTKKQNFMNASQTRSMMRSLANQKRIEWQQNMAKSRKLMLENKMMKIRENPKRQNREVLQSQHNLYQNLSASFVDQKKQNHNVLMHKIHEVLQKLKDLKHHQKLPKRDLMLLLENMNKEDTLLYEQIVSYIKNTKDQFFQRKEKQQEQKLKKQKKNNSNLASCRKPLLVRNQNQ